MYEMLIQMYPFCGWFGIGVTWITSSPVLSVKLRIRRTDTVFRKDKKRILLFYSTSSINLALNLHENRNGFIQY
jgi:hypothetical protein